MADSNLSLAEYNEIIATNPLVFIKVGATWCPPCKVIKPVFHRLGEKYSAKFISIDVDTSEGNEKFAIEHKVQAYPTFLVFYNGKLIQTLMGAHKKSLEDMVEKMVNSPTDEYIWWGYTCNVCGRENVPGLLKVCTVDEFMVCSACDIPASHPHLKEKFKTCKEPMDVQRNWKIRQMADCNLTLQEYEDIIKSNPLVFVKVGTTWCPPCKVIKPIFKSLASKYPSAKFIAIDADTSDGNDAFAKKYEIGSYPTFLVFHNGKKIQSQIGADKKALEEMVEMMSTNPTDDYIWWGFSCDVCKRSNFAGILRVCLVDELMVCSTCDIPKDHEHSAEKFKDCANMDDFDEAQVYTQMKDRVKWLMSLEFCKLSEEEVTKLYLDLKGDRKGILDTLKGVTAQ